MELSACILSSLSVNGKDILTEKQENKYKLKLFRSAPLSYYYSFIKAFYTNSKDSIVCVSHS